MLERILIVIAVGVVFYVLIPALSQGLQQIGRKRLIVKLKNNPGIAATCSESRNGALLITPADSATGLTGTNAPGESFAITPERNRLFMMEKDGTIEEISWKSVFLIRNGVPVVYWPGKTGLARGLCVFHEEETREDFNARLALLADRKTRMDPISDPIKYFSVAVGAFLEFCLFLESIGNPEMRQASVAALVAVFGKALPYCPPGLFFTLAAQLVDHRGGQKKSRRRSAVGFILVTGGVILNICAVFFAILKVGFIGV